MQRRDPLLLLLLALYAVYSAVAIYNSSFAIGHTRWFCLFDDGMISMRYARNLADGFGLVWNPHGPRVEGFSNPLWVLFMAGLHLFALPPSKISLLVQTFGAALLTVNIVYVYRLARLLSGGSRYAALSAALLTALYYSLNFWGWEGMEVSAATLLITMAAFYAVQALREGRFSAAPYVLLTIGTLLRPDLFLPLAVLTAYLAWADGAHRKRHLLAGLVPGLVSLAGQTAARLAYYGDPLPNTYYLKMTGYPPLLRMARGAWEVAKFVAQSAGLPVLVPILALWRNAPMRRERGLLIALWAAQLCYNIYVGGDAWEYWGHASRFVTEAVPLFMVLLACVLHALTCSLRINGVPRRLTQIALAAVSLFLMDALEFPSVARDFAATFAVRSGGNEPSLTGPNPYYTASASLVDGVSFPAATMAVNNAGAAPYFAHRTCQDMLGKCDRVIGHQPMHRWTGGGRRRYTDFVPGHMKHDTAYSVLVLQPDIINDPFGWPEAQAAVRGRYTRLVASGITLHLRNASPRINWPVVRALAARPGNSLTPE